ncbi:unnamed protein product [Chrysoparadoxa australica]
MESGSGEGRLARWCGGVRPVYDEGYVPSAEEELAVDAVETLRRDRDGPWMVLKDIVETPRGLMFAWRAGVLPALQSIISEHQGHPEAEELVRIICRDTDCRDEAEKLGLMDDEPDAEAESGTDRKVRKGRKTWKPDLGIYPMRFTFTDSSDGESVTIYARQVHEKHRGLTTVGYILWSSAVIMARWLHCHRRQELEGKSVLEIGAGLGLLALVAGFSSSDVVVSDNLPAIMDNLKRNVELNAYPKEGVTRPDCAACVAGAMKVKLLDWDSLPKQPWEEGLWRDSDYRDGEPGEDVEDEATKGVAMVTREGQERLRLAQRLKEWEKKAVSNEEKYDVILASDVIYRFKHAIGLVRAITHLLPPHGVFHLMGPKNGLSTPREGSDRLPEVLTAAGLAFEKVQVVDDQLLQGVEEREFGVEWYRYRCTWGP